MGNRTIGPQCLHFEVVCAVLTEFHGDSFPLTLRKGWFVAAPMCAERGLHIRTSLIDSSPVLGMVTQVYYVEGSPLSRPDLLKAGVPAGEPNAPLSLGLS